MSRYLAKWTYVNTKEKTNCKNNSFRNYDLIKKIFKDEIQVKAISSYDLNQKRYNQFFKRQVTLSQAKKIITQHQLNPDCTEIDGDLKIWVLKEGKLKKQYTSGLGGPLIELYLQENEIKIKIENGSRTAFEKYGYIWNFMQTYQTAKRNCAKMNEHLKLLNEKMVSLEEEEPTLLAEADSIIESGLVIKDGFNLAALDKLVEKGVIIDDRDKKYE